MDILLIVMRLIHILAGVFWVGGALFIAVFVEPTARALGPDGGKFMQHMVGARRLSTLMALAAVLTVLAGLWLYWRASLGFALAWILAPSGLTLTIGALAGILGAVVGGAGTGRTSARMAALGRAMQAAGGPPQPAQLAEMQALQARLRQVGVWNAVLLVIAVAGMAMARYV
jgi:uncharacterized membrane protein